MKFVLTQALLGAFSSLQSTCLLIKIAPSVCTHESTQEWLNGFFMQSDIGKFY
jgi:hypothetical protein